MAAHEIDDETAGRHDLEAAPTCVVERCAHQLRADAMAFVGVRHFGMGEEQSIALLVIDGDRQAMRRVELVATECLVMLHGRHASLAVTSAAITSGDGSPVRFA